MPKLTWEDFTDIVGCGENAIAELENQDGISELFDTGSITIGIDFRTFVISLHVEEVK